MFGQVSSASITVWEPGHRYATQEDKNPDGTFTAFEWLIESRDGSGGAVEFTGSPSFAGMRTDDAMYTLIHGYNDMVFCDRACYFDGRDPAARDRGVAEVALGGLTA